MVSDAMETQNLKLKTQNCGRAAAIAQEDGSLKAVEIRRREGGFEILWAKSSEGKDKDIGLFAAECGLSIRRTDGGMVQTGDSFDYAQDRDSDRAVVVGYKSAGVVFYRICVPAIKEKEIAAIVRVQAETRLPLPPEQVELAWRAGQIRNNEVAVTIAAARRERLQEFVENVRGLEPGKILLDCEGVVEAWMTFFGGSESAKGAVVVSMAARSTQVCLVEDGRLSNAAVLDIGIDDLSAAGPTEQTETTEAFVQDMRSVLELFGYAGLGELPVFVLSDGSDAIEGIVSALRLAGLDARAAEPLSKELGAAGEIGAEELYEYRVPIGLAMLGLGAGAEELNIFERLYHPSGEKKTRHRIYSPKAAGAIAAVMLVMLVIVSYAVDAAGPGAIEKRVRASVSDADMDMLVQRQKLIRTVASERPNLLEILSLVSSSGSKGILLDSLQFKKGQPISITGQADNADLLYKFQESLLTKKGIKQVEIQNAAKDPRGDKFKFTITFHYRNFTTKKVGPAGNLQINLGAK
jgi:hypothetical protein